MMNVGGYALLFAGALAGGFVSGLAGFGTALMALGIWLYLMPPSLAVPLARWSVRSSARARRCPRCGAHSI
jgi:hypothetical protein